MNQPDGNFEHGIQGDPIRKDNLNRLIIIKYTIKKIKKKVEWSRKKQQRERLTKARSISTLGGRGNPKLANE